MLRSKDGVFLVPGATCRMADDYDGLRRGMIVHITETGVHYEGATLVKLAEFMYWIPCDKLEHICNPPDFRTLQRISTATGSWTQVDGFLRHFDAPGARVPYSPRGRLFGVCPGFSCGYDLYFEVYKNDAGYYANSYTMNTYMHSTDVASLRSGGE